jgi:RNA 3'-terminal phosphate cyclase (ATP)
VSRSVRAIVANLPFHIASREVEYILDRLAWESVAGSEERATAHGPGNVVFVELASEHITEVFTGFGRTGARAEQVADEVVRQVRDFLRADVPVGPYLADQILLPLGISAWQTDESSRQRGGSFRTLPLTRHSTTHIEILRQFLDIDIRVERSADGESCHVSVA